MKSITIHNLDDELYYRIQSSAKKNHRSLNQEIKDKLFKYFFPDINKKNNSSFKNFLGIWDDSDFKEFNDNTKDFEKISN